MKKRTERETEGGGIAARFDADTVRRLYALAEKIGYGATLSGIIREAVKVGLPVLEAKQGAKR